MFIQYIYDGRILYITYSSVRQHIRVSKPMRINYGCI